MTLRKRLDRLEGKRGGAGGGPSMILICDPVTGKSGGALFKCGGGLAREPAEDEAAFMVRAAIQQAGKGG